MLAGPAIHQLDGKYRVLALLGQGGTADVSLAALCGPSGFSKLVVLKSMKPSLKMEPEFARMFMTEARLAARLNHPNIVQTNEVFEFEGLPVIVMEYLEGQSLSNVRGRARGTSRFTLAMHLRVLADILDGLHYSHELTDYDGTPLEVVHRDVSPHNVFVTFDGQVKLLDFGIAKLAGVHSDTSTGVLKGKLRYMSPEQIAAEGVDRRSDVYSVGVMLWEAATGTHMWRGLSDAAVMNRILSGDFEKASGVKSDVSPELEHIIEKAMAPDPADRFASAAEMRAALDEYLAGMAQLHSREIGKAVAELFADVRRQTKQLVDEQLSMAARLNQAEYERLPPLELTTFASVSAPSSGAGGAPGSTRLRQVRVYAVVAALVGSVFLLSLLGWKAFGSARTASVPVPSGAPAATLKHTEPDRVSLRVTVFPSTAKLTLGGKSLVHNPSKRSFSRDPARTVLLEAAAEGHITQTRMLRLDRDWDVVLTLEESPDQARKGKAGRLKASPAARPKRAPESPSLQAAGECDPPYFIDARGVKKYKAQCL